MVFTPHFRKLILTLHIIFSVGWLGAVAVFLVHSIAGLYSNNPSIVRAAYLAMNISAWIIILPACLGSLLTGIFQSLGTQWGLFKYYWIVVKLLLTIGATILLLVHMQPISLMADIVANSPLTGTEHRALQMQLFVDAALALIVLLATTTVSVFKPWGLTSFGLKKLNKKLTKPTSSSGKWIIVGIIVLVILFIITHLLGGGLGKH